MRRFTEKAKVTLEPNRKYILSIQLPNADRSPTPARHPLRSPTEQHEPNTIQFLSCSADDVVQQYVRGVAAVRRRRRVCKSGVRHVLRQFGLGTSGYGTSYGNSFGAAGLDMSAFTSLMGNSLFSQSVGYSSGLSGLGLGSLSSSYPGLSTNAFPYELLMQGMPSIPQF